ncbi:photosynthetic NDH subunit of lumenal location 3, chloroplastic-like [Macadamia integrifolia]|uniref:photosynthetic NDH subunit of lumenal location 3, chloroplastic-like n=1 Tax=Macadamia integrifolia TaxID=60698 RepID=UPI001C4E5ACB|nr:photosynthetic NDH subunit of lumenal location 3, chloroplastic-like [Macadamia integrifolia]XP_042486661.1 photosynthetic NDH subunit of lumenal location 3, chloroplastic-like [Macadamia integrifolia]
MNMEDVQSRGSKNRIKKCVFDLLSIGEMSDDENSWDILEKDLRLKSVFLYCDFSRVISHAPEEQKKSLTELANRLFYYIEELDHAVKLRNIPLTQNRYSDAAVVLHEVMSVML